MKLMLLVFSGRSRPFHQPVLSLLLCVCFGSTSSHLPGVPPRPACLRPRGAKHTTPASLCSLSISHQSVHPGSRGGGGVSSFVLLSLIRAANLCLRVSLMRRTRVLLPGRSESTADVLLRVDFCLVKYN